MKKENIITYLGGVIKSTRIEKHLTQKQLAERLSISTRYLMSIENKKQIPSCDLLFRLVRELGIPADSIFYPEHKKLCPLLSKAQLYLGRCSEKEISVIVATLQSMLDNK